MTKHDWHGATSWKPNMTSEEKEEYNAYRRFLYQNDEKYRTRRQQANVAAKLEMIESRKNDGCEVCGEKRYWVLDFHHVDPSTKLFAIGTSRRYSAEAVEEELSKCIVLCSNCHRDLHYRLGLHDKGG